MFKEMDKIGRIEEKLEENNYILAETLGRNSIYNLCLTSGTNSIGSGYSMARTIMPLLYRNKTLESIMKNKGIELERHHFSRAQNNCDEHFYDWLILNIKESEIMKMNYSDYSNESTSMPVRDKSEEMELLMKLFSNQNINQDKGLQDILLKSSPFLANILVYNGATGSFLDNITRGGKISECAFYGIKRDIASIEATLKFIQVNNRNNLSNTQVYLCGAPKILCFSELINKRLREVAYKYAGVSYVEPVSTKLLYKRVDNNKVCFDIHYNEVEYLKFSNNIIDSIIDNFAPNKEMIKIDRALQDFSSFIEIKGHNIKGDNEFIYEYMDNLLENSFYNLNAYREKRILTQKYAKYLTKRMPYDFYYLEKKNIKKSISKCKKMTR